MLLLLLLLRGDAMRCDATLACIEIFIAAFPF
jgi:hypothetical protein